MLIRLFDPGDKAPSPTEPTVARIVSTFLDDMDARALAGLITPETAYRARLYAGCFAADLGQLVVSECRQTDLVAWIARHPEYASPHSMHDACGAVVAAFRWAAEAGLVQRCPYRRPRDLPQPEPRVPILAAEVRKILEHGREGRGRTPGRFRLALWFLWETGCRTCELYRLDWSMYDDVRGCFELPSKTTRKTGKKRLLVLPARAWRLIRMMARHRIMAAAAANLIPAKSVKAIPTLVGAVFLNGRNRRWTKSSFGKLFRLHADAAGVRSEVSAYCCRHGFCCEALEGGAGERQLADYLGHSGTKYISWYGRGVKEKVDYLRGAAAMRRRD